MHNILQIQVRASVNFHIKHQNGDKKKTHSDGDFDRGRTVGTKLAGLSFSEPADLQQSLEFIFRTEPKTKNPVSVS